MPAAPAGEPQLKCEFKDNDSDMIVSHVADAFLLVTTDTNTGNEIETTCSNRSRADLNSIGLLFKTVFRFNGFEVAVKPHRFLGG